MTEISNVALASIRCGSPGTDPVNDPEITVAAEARKTAVPAQPRILIADDDSISLMLMSAVLTASGLDVIEARDGEAAYRLAMDYRPDFLIVDLVMPGLSGFDLCTRLRALRCYASVPILAVSGLDDFDSIEKAYAAGATDFIVKPIVPVLLQHRVQYMLRAASVAAENERKNELLRFAAARLRATNHSLERRVEERTGELQRANDKLRHKHGQMLTAKKAAETASRSKTEFLANMNHELRTPLNAIIGFSSVIHDRLYGSLDDKYIDAAAIIGEAGTHLLGLINNVLDLARAEVDRIPLHEEYIDIHEVIRVVRHIIGEMAHKAEIEFRVNIADYLQVIYADATRLRQILINLLANAVKFTPAGGMVCFDITHNRHGSLVFRIEDTGIGIPEDKIPLIFRPFGQIQNTSVSHRYPGSGIGLPLALRLVHLHGGRLKLASRLGYGTVVTVTLPPKRSRLPGKLRAQDVGAESHVLAISAP